MGKNKSVFILLALLLCLLLTACGQTTQNEVPPSKEAPPSTEKPVEVPPPTPSETEKPVEGPAVLDRLTVEIVVDWEDSDRVLSQLDQLSRLLQTALAEQNYEVENVTVTLSTAGGFTANALAEGGVDAACLPAVDFVAVEGAEAILATDQELAECVVAVSLARKELDTAFQEALSTALLESEAGREFLDLCCPGEVYVPASQESIQAVRDWVAEQEAEQEAG